MVTRSSKPWAISDSMQTIPIQLAESQLSTLLDRAAAGEEIVIAREGRPVARLVALATKDSPRRRRLGALAGKLVIPDDFDASLPDEVLAAFEGR